MASSDDSSSDEVDPSLINHSRMYAQMGFPVVILGQQYCSNHPLELMFELNQGNEKKFKVTAKDGFVLFTTTRNDHHCRVLLNDKYEPVMTFVNKHISMHKRRQAFKGDSSNPRDLLFSVKKKKGLKSLKYDVFLSSNITESKFNFRIYDNHKDGTSTIYAGDETTVMAQLHTGVIAHEKTVTPTNYTVLVSPNVDHAFVAALVMIREDIIASNFLGKES